MLKPGNHVRHEKFGTGVILEVNRQTALVEWDSHQVVRDYERPGKSPLRRNHSHVNLGKLSVIASSIGADGNSGEGTALRIGPAYFDRNSGDLTVTIEGQLFNPGEKYTILEMGWAVYLAVAPLPDGWLPRYGEVRPAEEEWNELASGGEMLITSHPVLVTLGLRAWWHGNGHPIATAPAVIIPTFAEAVQEVRCREIFNDFNARYAGAVPGLRRWRS
jgi:hypothetical protein